MQNMMALENLPPRAQTGMPRFRLRGAEPKEYVLAAPFKREPGYWFMWNDQWFSVMDDTLFQFDYTPSNQEARDLLQVNAEKTGADVEIENY